MKKFRINNYKILFILRVLKSILTLFTESFLVLYFLELSDSNILPLGVYNIVAMTVVFLTIFLLKNKCKSENRVRLLRIGIILDLVYFLAIMLLRDKIINYIYLIGILYGLEEGFYFSVYNVFESDGIKNDERAKFNGVYRSLSSILGILFPLIFGSLIAATNFNRALILVLVIVIIRIFLSFLFKDQNVPKENKTNLKEYFNIVKQHKCLKYIHKINLGSGLTYSSGAFLSIITVYIVRVCNDSMSLGIFTSGITIIIALIAFLFAYVIKDKAYIKIIFLTTIMTIISLILMLLNCNIVQSFYLTCVQKQIGNSLI